MTQEYPHPPHHHRPPRVIELPGLPIDFQAFHQLHRPAYVKWAELFLNSRADAEEAVDHAMMQLLSQWPCVLQQPEPAAYAWTVLKHRTIDTARARGRRPVLIDTAAFDTHAVRTAARAAADPIGELEESLSIYQAIKALPERQHDVVVLRYSLGYTTSETATILGITEAGVRSTARYAKRRLKQALGLEKGKGDDHTEVD
jgi:RNA polymerase sigma-70 factor (ECF subfamily)